MLRGRSSSLGESPFGEATRWSPLFFTTGTFSTTLPFLGDLFTLAWVTGEVSLWFEGFSFSSGLAFPFPSPLFAGFSNLLFAARVGDILVPFLAVVEELSTFKLFSKHSLPSSVGELSLALFPEDLVSFFLLVGEGFLLVVS